MTDCIRTLAFFFAITLSAPALHANDAKAEKTVAPAIDFEQSAARPDVIDALQLETTSIRGNQELPKVLYIVPWKEPSVGNLVGKPVSSLIDEVLAPVDRDVFRRQTNYFGQLYGGTEAGDGD
jgi:hypothetical protein